MHVLSIMCCKYIMGVSTVRRTIRVVRVGGRGGLRVACKVEAHSAVSWALKGRGGGGQLAKIPV